MGLGGGECSPHRDGASVIEHMVCQDKVDLSEGDRGQQWGGPLSPHRSFLLCHCCLCEMVALNGQTGGGICEVRKQHLCSGREAKGFLEESE